jgi:A/G-specific adenine glycosylase
MHLLMIELGPFTALAIASIAFDVCSPIVDGNVCRILSRLCGIANHIKAPILKDNLVCKQNSFYLRSPSKLEAN